MLDKLTTIQALLTATLQLVLMNQGTGYIYCDLRLVFLLEQLEEQCMDYGKYSPTYCSAKIYRCTLVP